MGTFRLYDNDDDFRQGNLYEANLWTQARLNDAFSASFLLRGFRQDRVSGADPAVNSAMSFVFDPVAQEREGIDIGTGINFTVPSGPLKGQRLAVEATTPIYERINGYGLERDYRLTAGWQYAF
ncbi:MAG: transporter, partial [Pseudomonadota bacterium]